jgi:ech hydrogenase subunit D
MTDRNELVQDIRSAEVENLLAIAQDTKTAGYRLCQICATMAGESIEVLYTFEKDNVLKNYKFTIDAKEPELQSITAIYHYAFIYENEMGDLFGIKFRNLAVDYEGKFFVVAKERPWNPLYGNGGEN